MAALRITFEFARAGARFSCYHFRSLNRMRTRVATLNSSHDVPASAVRWPRHLMTDADSPQQSEI